MKSPFRHNVIHCNDSLESMLIVLLDLQQGEYEQIKLEHEKISIINSHLINQLKGFESLYVFN